MALDRRGHGGLHRGQVIELVDHSNVQIFDAGLAVYANFQNIITTAASKAGSEFEALIFMAKRCDRCLRMGKALLRFCSIYDKMCTHLHYILSHKFL